MEFKGTKAKWILETRTTRPETYWIIALDKSQILPICSILRDNSRANAQLISKAPEMLRMLQSIVDDFEGDYVMADGRIVDNPYQWLIDRYKQAKQLIKEATEC